VVHEWVRRWEITEAWERPADSPVNARRRQYRVDSPAQLRAALTAARADRLMVGLRYTSVRELVGTTPETCGRGHPLEGGTANRATLEWIQCSCGGHVVYVCKTCADRLVDPTPTVDCVVVRRG
jgi:hypothetical protein